MQHKVIKFGSFQEASDAFFTPQDRHDIQNGIKKLSYVKIDRKESSRALTLTYLHKGGYIVIIQAKNILDLLPYIRKTN